MTIYLTAFPLGTGSGAVHGSQPGGDVLGCALAEDGHVLAQHLSSSVAFSKHDMGLTSDWQHDRYRAHCPDGFDVVWIDDRTDPRWRAAMERNNDLAHDGRIA